MAPRLISLTRVVPPAQVQGSAVETLANGGKGIWVVNHEIRPGRRALSMNNLPASERSTARGSSASASAGSSKPATTASPGTLGAPRCGQEPDPRAGAGQRSNQDCARVYEAFTVIEDEQ